MKTLFLATVLLLTLGVAPWLTGRAGAQGVNVGDSCYTLQWHQPELGSNADSILVDSCQSTPGHPDFWVRTRGFRIVFQGVMAIVLPWAPPDSDIEVTWQEIDTVYPTLRAAFDSLELRYGHYKFRKEFPDDVTTPMSQAFFLNFEDYVEVDSVYPELSDIEGVASTVVIPLDPGRGVRQSYDIEPQLRIYPNPAWSALSVHILDGFNWEHLEIVDALGRAVQKISDFSRSPDIQIDLSNLGTGLFFLQFGNDRIPFIHLK